MLRLRKFMFDRVYLGPAARREQERVQRTLRGLFDHYMEHPEETPEGEPGASDAQRVTDYLAGMTDRYCIARFTELTVPEEARFCRMALISPDSLERVKQTADIVEVISAHTDLRRQGTRWVGLCPFHEERTPSFSVDAQEKLYHCFGCGVGGDTIKFVEEKEGLELRRRGRAARRPLRGRARAREGGPAGRGAPRSSARRLEELLDRTAAFYARLPLGLRGGRQGPRVHGRARPRRGGPARLRGRLRAERLGHGPAARPAGRLQGRRAARRRAGPARPGRRRVRPLPLADHLPDPRPPRPHARLRRAGDALRPGRQVRQHGGDRLLPQEPDALRDRPARRRRSPRPGARSSSRATPTCSPCTRPGSRRRSG